MCFLWPNTLEREWIAERDGLAGRSHHLMQCSDDTMANADTVGCGLTICKPLDRGHALMRLTELPL